MNHQLSQQPKTSNTAPGTPIFNRRDSPSEGSIELHAIVDSASIQRALSVVINAVAARTLDPARAKVLLYGLQIASTNARRVATSPNAETIVSVETTSDERPHAAPATVSVEPNSSQSACIDEREQTEMKIEHMNAVEDDNTPAEATPEVPDPHAGPARHMHTPPSCFTPASGYSGGVRERLLAIRQRSEWRSVV